MSRDLQTDDEIKDEAERLCSPIQQCLAYMAKIGCIEPYIIESSGIFCPGSGSVRYRLQNPGSPAPDEIADKLRKLVQNSDLVLGALVQINYVSISLHEFTTEWEVTFRW